MSAGKPPYPYSIRRIETGTSYPRNGNLDNPTKRYRWEVSFRDKPIGILTRRGDVPDLITEHQKSLVWCERCWSVEIPDETILVSDVPLCDACTMATTGINPLMARIAESEIR